MTHPAGIDYDKLNALVEKRMPPNAKAQDRVRWSKKLSDQIVEEYMNSGRLSEIMLSGAADNSEQKSGSSGAVVLEKTAEKPELTEEQLIAREEESKRHAQSVANIETMEKQGINETKRKERIKNSQKSVSQVKDSTSDTESVHHIPKNVIAALRQVFSSTASKRDLISAMVYLFTDGMCEIPDSAMQLVKDYKKEDSLVSVNERLSHIEHVLKAQGEMLQSVELCTCYDLFDRRYGAQASRKSPRETEFREKGSLDLLERLRVQAKDQRADDYRTHGREIWDSKKGRND